MRTNVLIRLKDHRLINKQFVGLSIQLNIVKILLKGSGKVLSWLLMKGWAKILTLLNNSKHFQSNFILMK